MKLPANRPPWTASGIGLAAGDQVTVFSAGRAGIAEDPNIWVGSHFALWMRIGPEGEIFRAPGHSFTFTVGAGGQLYLSNLFPGDWADRQGHLATSVRHFERVTGTLAILVMRWKVDPPAGLDRLARAGSDGAAIVGHEASRLRNPGATPAGWQYLWSIGDSGIFDSVRDLAGKPIILCRMQDDAAILQRPVHLRLDPTVRLRWSWKINALPSLRREDAVPNHDYFSVALEFDNGQDLTYLWSATIPPETSFRCPISRWNGRETHMVVRSGTERLKEWVNEDRNICDDYSRAIGTPPAAIVAVWLIGVSIFAHTFGYCEYSAIELVSEAKSIPLT